MMPFPHRNPRQATHVQSAMESCPAVAEKLREEEALAASHGVGGLRPEPLQCLQPPAACLRTSRPWDQYNPR